MRYYEWMENYQGSQIIGEDESGNPIMRDGWSGIEETDIYYYTFCGAFGLEGCVSNWRDEWRIVYREEPDNYLEPGTYGWVEIAEVYGNIFEAMDAVRAIIEYDAVIEERIEDMSRYWAWEIVATDTMEVFKKWLKH